MICSGRILALSISPTPRIASYSPKSNAKFLQERVKSNLKWRLMANDNESPSFAPAIDAADPTDKNAAGSASNKDRAYLNDPDRSSGGPAVDEHFCAKLPHQATRDIP